MNCKSSCEGNKIALMPIAAMLLQGREASERWKAKRP
jgi:hypothetical protein